ncbi:hypothetical protein THICB2_30209 [Thiomonas sp. CB2]|nr:hypothetical protein THICB2_30209 [Thiomonas sp. CB2]VDY06310.1 protein of unknown function [Thiomonas sp. Bio17B3]VDY10394.1 protein of unknown function [Thiomonas sp. Sup16B3]VDY14581.1 conserved protein of unknown function [Thiomonas sp. OC7]VDY16239.1 protein of unknown function [Thiomonas sp. CB2]
MTVKPAPCAGLISEGHNSFTITERPTRKTKAQALAWAWVFGGPKEDRTPDLCIANAALSQLSYRPEKQNHNRRREAGSIAGGGVIGNERYLRW